MENLSGDAGPSCRSAISEDKLFSLQAFEPSDADLAGVNEDEDEEMLSESDIKGKSKAKEKPKPRYKPALRPRRRVRDSEVIHIDCDDEESGDEDDDDEDDDMSDFIVESDEDEEEKDLRRALKTRMRKRASRAVIVDSDDEFADTPQDAEAIFGARPKMDMPREKIKLMPRFLPSTKMKVSEDFFSGCASLTSFL